MRWNTLEICVIDKKQSHEADYFLTRDAKDFGSVVPYVLPVLSPLQFEYMLL